MRGFGDEGSIFPQKELVRYPFGLCGMILPFYVFVPARNEDSTSPHRP